MCIETHFSLFKKLNMTKGFFWEGVGGREEREIMNFVGLFGRVSP